MNGDFVTSILLPAMLAFIMFTLGLGIRIVDFKRVAERPVAIALGGLCHFVILPLVCFVMLGWFGLRADFAVGMMLVAACPTGTSSNLLTRIAGADVALAITFTVIASIVTVFTLPLIVRVAMGHFLGSDTAIAFPAAYMMWQIVMLLALPVACGMLINAFRPAFASRIEPGASKLATLCFVLTVVAAAMGNWSVLTEHFVDLAPFVILLNLTMLLCGFLLAKWARLDIRQVVTLAIESAMQNATLAIVIASSVLHRETLAIPGLLYGILMYAGGITFAFGVRRWTIPNAIPAKV